MLAAFTYRDFRVQWFGACSSSIGTWTQLSAQNWMVLALTGSAFYLGLDAFLQQLPIMLFTLIGGVLADRRDRRRTLLASQYVQMATATTLALLVFFGIVEIWHILLLSFPTGLAQAFGGPAYQALIPSLVDKKDLPNAVALNSIQFNVARVLGPLAFGVTIAAFARWGFTDAQGMAACCALNAASCLLVISALIVQAVYGLLILGFATSHVLWVSEILLFLTGAALMVVFSTVTSLIQLIAPNEMRGRVMSIYMVAFRGGMPLGSLVSGYLATFIAAPMVMGLNGVLPAIVASDFLVLSREVREA